MGLAELAAHMAEVQGHKNIQPPPPIVFHDRSVRPVSPFSSINNNDDIADFSSRRLGEGITPDFSLSELLNPASESPRYSPTRQDTSASSDIPWGKIAAGIGGLGFLGAEAVLFRKVGLRKGLGVNAAAASILACSAPMTEVARVNSETTPTTFTASESALTIESTPTIQPTETNTPLPTATETATPVPMSSLEQSVIGLLDEMKVPYTKTNENGVITLVNNETGKDILRNGRVAIEYAVELAKKDCEPTNIEPDKYGFVQQKDYDSSDIYISTIISGLNYPTRGGFFFVLIDREKQCWVVADRDNLLYKDETLEHIIPIIPLTKDELFTFAMSNK